MALAFNDMVRTGELSAPIVIGRDHLDSGSVASPNRETEAMMVGHLFKSRMYIRIYICIYIHVCVCVCVCGWVWQSAIGV